MEPNRINARPKTRIATTLAVFGLFILMALIGLLVRPLLLVSLAGLAVLVLAIPWCLKAGVEWLSIWSLAVLSVFISIFIRALYIALEFPDFQTIDEMFLRGQSMEFLLRPLLLVICGFVFLVAGYCLHTRLPQWLAETGLARRIFETGGWSENRFWLSVVILMGISLIAFAAYLQATGGFDASIISAKRSVSRGLQLDANYRGHGYLNLLVRCAQIVAFLLASRVFTKKQGRLRDIVILVPIVIYCLFFELYQSNRTGFAYTLLVISTIGYYLHKDKRVIAAQVALGALFILGGFHSLTILRNINSLEQYKNDGLKTVDVLNSVIINRNLADLSRTAHIIEATPEFLPFQYGATLITWVYAVVPREIWPEKPIIQVGQIIGNVVYGNLASGVPPGLIGELYWNFSWPGILLGCFLGGIFLRLLEDLLNPQSRNPNRVILYASIVTIGVDLLGMNVSTVVMNLLRTLVPIGLVLRFVSLSPRMVQLAPVVGRPIPGP